MRILALETSDKAGSLAALDGERLLKSVELDPATRSAKSLAGSLKYLLVDVGWRTTDVQLVAVAGGPGSFTGLRVGVTTAKTFAYATGASVLAVNTLEVIAGRAAHEVHSLWAVMDAQRQQVYAAQYIRDGGLFRNQLQTEIRDIEAWLALLNPGECVTGPILNRLAERLPAGLEPLSPDLWSPTAEQVGHLALTQYGQGRRDDVWKLVPQYFRKSAAEEKLEQNAKSVS